MILIMPDNYNQIVENINLYEGIILSIEKFSVNSRYKITLMELKKILKILKGKEVYISINKNIEDSELDDLENLLYQLKNYNINGVIYSDLAILTYKDKLNYKLIWGQEHLVTNYETINYYDNLGIDGAYLSSDITKKEIIEIINNTNTKIFINVFGYIPMFVSKRNIVKNYLKNFNIRSKSEVYYMKKEGKTYPIIDTDLTYVYANNIFNGIEEYFNIKSDYYICNGFLIENENFSEVLSLINNINKKNVKKISEKVNSMLINEDTGFLYKETVSKIK